MSKLTPVNTGATPSFEETDMPDTKAAGAAPSATEATTATAVAVTKPTGLVANPVQSQVALTEILTQMDGLKNAMQVEYNTLSQITAQQGNFMDRETSKILGDTVVFMLESYQDSYIVSPEDEDADADKVRYSADGIHCTDGTMVADHLAFLRENGYPKAKLKQRVVVVGAIESASRSTDFNDELVQFDISPASRVMWNRYMSTSAYKIKTGKMTLDNFRRIKATTEVVKGEGNNTFTKVMFSAA